MTPTTPTSSALGLGALHPRRRLSALVVLLALASCTRSEAVRRIEHFADEQCACIHTDCALEVHGRFNEAWHGLEDMGRDWSAKEHQRELWLIENAAKRYSVCLNDHFTAYDATEACQASEEARDGEPACRACCEANGRFFRAWIDPSALGVASALGDGSVRGCTCK